MGSYFEFGLGKDGDVKIFQRRMRGDAYHRELGLEGKEVFIVDGVSWIDEFAEASCLKRVRVVNWYHAVEHLWVLGREAFGEEATEWVKKVKQKLWDGEVEQVIQECEEVLGEENGVE